MTARLRNREEIKFERHGIAIHIANAVAPNKNYNAKCVKYEIKYYKYLHPARFEVYLQLQAFGEGTTSFETLKLMSNTESRVACRFAF